MGASIYKPASISRTEIPFLQEISLDISAHYSMDSTTNSLSMSLKIKKQPYNSIWISADSQQELGETFIRFQEHYESNNQQFKNKIFTIGQLKQWYSETYGYDGYAEHWSGFNLPSVALKPFRSGLFDPLTPYEQNLLDAVKYRQDNFYIIGAQNKSVLRHELSHSLYAYSEKYRNEINSYIKKYNAGFKTIKKHILDMGYCTDVLNDEIQAYVTDLEDQYIFDNLSSNLIHGIIKIYKRNKTHDDS